MKTTEYNLINVADSHLLKDSGWTLSDSESAEASMVRADYAQKKFSPDADAAGIYRYHHWLPIRRSLRGSCAPVTYKSEGLAGYLGLENLFITFSGWNPLIGARFKTCSFKETEAYSVCSRLDRNNGKILTVSSAGNTARAFASVCSHNHIPLLVTIPYDNLDAMWFDRKLDPCVKIVASSAGSDYFDAISIADKICSDPMFLSEGGARNIARRDGMGTTLLSAVETIGAIPDAYFQAVGSGTGAIAAWENNLRLIGDGRFGSHKMKLHLSQNDPFTIIYESWQSHSRNLVDFSADQARRASSLIKAKVLSNRKPPYSLRGGLYDALCDCGGYMYKVSNAELEEWKQRFLSLEGVDIYSAAAVAVASLAQALSEGTVSKQERIMLNITGGGEKQRKEMLGSRIYRAAPSLVLDADTPADEVIPKVKALF